jgi:tetratricopeptide (TPR) repeat protein
LRAEWDAAVQDLTQALEIHKRVGHVAAMVESLVQIGSIAEARQAQDDAQEAYRQAVSLADQMDTGPCVVAAHRHFGLLLLLKQQDSTGAEHIEHAVDLAETMRGSLEYAPTLLARARLERQKGNVNQALDTVAQVFLAPLTAEVAAMAHMTCAHLLLEVSRTDEASAHVAEGLRLATSLGSPLLLASAHHTSAAVAAAFNDQTAATQALASATRYFETAGLTPAQRM